MMVKPLPAATHTHGFATTHAHTKPLKTGKRLSRYLERHPLAFWIFTLIGMPMGILLGVGTIAALFGMLISIIAE